jgi:uncharacterized membrane protein YdbT with pleckstrin-like domain
VAWPAASGTRDAVGLRNAVNEEVGWLPGNNAGEEAEWMRPRSRVTRGVLVATGAVVLVAAGIAGYLSFGYPPWEAAAMTLLTLTTVGFASSSHLSTGVLVFTAGLAFLGVGLFFVILGWPRPRSWKAG